MKWQVHRRRPVYESPWVEVWLDDVELPDGRRFEHHVLRMRPTVVGIVFDERGERVLMLWRHRFITDTWGWELPGGWIDEGERPGAAAAREVEEETGWRPQPMREVGRWHNMPGISDVRCTLYRADGATYVGEPVEAAESTRVDWVAVTDLRQRIDGGEITDGDTLIALALTGAIAPAADPAAGRRAALP
ncbi:MAG: NUDIX domain-containing protein [Solirubrobacteraceae bacterium]